jgi:hypothetical protein
MKLVAARFSDGRDRYLSSVDISKLRDRRLFGKDKTAQRLARTQHAIFDGANGDARDFVRIRLWAKLSRVNGS